MLHATSYVKAFETQTDTYTNSVSDPNTTLNADVGSRFVFYAQVG